MNASKSNQMLPADLPKSNLWLVIFVLAFAGAIVAGASKAPVIWMLVWPAPLIVIFTAAEFIRRGYHKRDGVLVLGSPEPSQRSGLSDSPSDYHPFRRDSVQCSRDSPVCSRTRVAS